MDSKLVDILSFVLPFANEIANVLTTSGLPLFKNLYKPCIDPYLINGSVKINKEKICRTKYIINKMLVDLVALSGIIMLIAKNAVKHGFTEAFLVGLMIVFLSFIFPNLFLHQILHFFGKMFKIKSPYGIIAIGFLIIALLLYISYILEKLIQRTFSFKNNTDSSNLLARHSPSD